MELFNNGNMEAQTNSVFCPITNVSLCAEQVDCRNRGKANWFRCWMPPIEPDLRRTCRLSTCPTNTAAEWYGTWQWPYRHAKLIDRDGNRSHMHFWVGVGLIPSGSCNYECSVFILPAICGNTVCWIRTCSSKHGCKKYPFGLGFHRLIRTPWHLQQGELTNG